jgi:hypothetical protein
VLHQSMSVGWEHYRAVRLRSRSPNLQYQSSCIFHSHPRS